jgi:hypothetical protein
MRFITLFTMTLCMILCMTFSALHANAADVRDDKAIEAQ